MKDGLNNRGERAALYGGIGAAIGTVFGAALISALGILGIALFAIVGAVGGVVIGFLYKGSGGNG